MNRMISSCRIQITVEVPTDGTYGPEWKIEDMFTQVASEGKQKLQNILAGKGRIIGEPKVVFVTGEQQR